MKFFFFSNNLIIWCFRGNGDRWEAKMGDGLDFCCFLESRFAPPWEEGSSSDSSGSFPKPAAGNQVYFVSVLPLSLLLPPFHQNILWAILAKTAQQSKAFQMPRGGREEVKLFCLFCMPELWNLPSIVLVINILGSGKQYGSSNFYWNFASC